MIYSVDRIINFSNSDQYILLYTTFIYYTYTAALGSFVVSHHSACFLMSCFTFLGSLLPMKSCLQYTMGKQSKVTAVNLFYGNIRLLGFASTVNALIALVCISLSYEYHGLSLHKVTSLIHSKQFFQQLYLCIFKLPEVCEHLHGLNKIKNIND